MKYNAGCAEPLELIVNPANFDADMSNAVIRHGIRGVFWTRQWARELKELYFKVSSAEDHCLTLHSFDAKDSLIEWPFHTLFENFRLRRPQ